MPESLVKFEKRMLQESIGFAKSFSEDATENMKNFDQQLGYVPSACFGDYYKMMAELLYYKRVAEILAEKAGVTI